ncbi:MAG: hypothetical protein HQ513_19805 [Rhodospirillales bacterium]|nr:hypothetical protein [Rhodospirillales bacterium]
MDENQFPKDENLRLILSTDQEQWLQQRIRDWHRFTWVMAVMLVVSSAWVTAYAAGAFARYDEPECMSFVGSTLSIEQQREQLASSGLEACPQSTSAQGAQDSDINWEDVRLGVTVSSVLVILLTFLGLLRGLFQLRMYKGYLTDHRAFLEKYNRL